MFELQVCQSGEWKRLNTFEARRDAMSAAIELERAKRYSGIKIFRLAFDEDRMANTKKLVHIWSEEADRKVKDKELEEHIDRQREERRKIREKKKIELEKRKKKIRNYILVSSLSITLILCFAILSALVGA
jgi:hypothetical protein